MSPLKFILLLTFPLTVAGQNSGNYDSYEYYKKFIKSLEFCSPSEIQDTACNRLKRARSNFSTTNSNFEKNIDYITLNGEEKSSALDFTSDTSVNNLCSIIKSEKPIIIQYESSFSTDFWTTKYSTFNSKTLSLQPPIIFFEKDTVVAWISGDYEFTIHEIKPINKEVIKSLYSSDNDPHKNYFIKLKYTSDNIYNILITAKERRQLIVISLRL